MQIDVHTKEMEIVVTTASVDTLATANVVALFSTHARSTVPILVSMPVSPSNITQQC